MKFYPRMIFLLGVAVSSMFYRQLNAQVSGILESARVNPPANITIAAHREALSAIEWQLEQFARLVLLSEADVKAVRDRLTELEKEIRELFARIPLEHRAVDKQVRALLAGKLLEEMIDARLDIATNKSVIAELAKQMAQSGQSGQPVEEIIVREAQVKVQHAEHNIELLRQKGFSKKASNVDLHKAETSLRIAQLELEKARAKVKVAKKATQSRAAERLAELRVEQLAAKSRLSVAEKMIDSFSEYEELYLRQQRLQLEWDRFQKRYNALLARVNDLKQERQELRVTKDLLEAHLSSRTAHDEDAHEGKMRPETIK